MQTFSTMNFSELYWLHPTNFNILHFYFLFSSILFFSFPLKLLFQPTDCLEVCCLIFRYLEIFPLSFFYWVVNWLHCIQITYSVYFQFSKVFEGFFFEIHHVTYLIDCFNGNFKELYFAILGELFKKYQNLLAGSVVQPFCILNDILSSNFWERWFGVPNHNCRFKTFFLLILSVLLQTFWNFLIGVYIFRIAIPSWWMDLFL